MGRVARLGRVGHSRSSVMSGTGRLGTTMKITSGLLSLLVLAMAGASPMPAQICGPDVKHSTKAVENKSPLETSPPADKALIYVLAPTNEAGNKQMKLAADRSWVGVNLRHTYFVTALA